MKDTLYYIFDSRFVFILQKQYEASCGKLSELIKTQV